MTEAEHMRLAEKLVRLFDTQFQLGSVRFGLDALLNVWPWMGGAVSAGASMYLFYLAYLFKVPRFVYVQMLVNVFLDFIIGQLPLGVGVIADAFYKANARNFELIRKFSSDEGVLEGEIIE